MKQSKGGVQLMDKKNYVIGIDYGSDSCRSIIVEIGRASCRERVLRLV